VILVGGRDIAALIEIDAGLVDHAGLDRAGEAERDELRIGADHRLSTLDRPALLVGLCDLHAGDAAILADEAERHRLELTLGAFGLRGRGTHLGWPIGPDGELVFLLGWPRADVELRHRNGALAEGGTDAVGSRVAAPDDHDMLARGEERLFLA